MNQVISFEDLNGHLETSEVNIRVFGLELANNRDVGVTFVVVLRRA